MEYTSEQVREYLKVAHLLAEFYSKRHSYLMPTEGVGKYCFQSLYERAQKVPPGLRGENFNKSLSALEEMLDLERDAFFEQISVVNHWDQ